MAIYTIETPEGRQLRIEADSESEAMRGAKTWSMQQRSGKKSTLWDQAGAFAQSATEQIPFLDEAAAGVVAMTSGRPYKDVRRIQKDLATEDRRERPLSRNAGGVAGFGATLAAPGAGFIKGAGSLSGAAARAGVVGAGYGALSGAGGADGGLEDRLKGGAGGALVGATTGAAAPYVGRAISEGLKKAPKAMTVAELEAAKRAAYKDPALSGVVFSPQSRKDLARSLQTEMLRMRMSAKRHPAADGVLKDVLGDLKSKSNFSLDDLDDLRQIAWRDAAGLKDADRQAEAMMGQRIVAMLDDFADKADATSVIAGDPEAAVSALKRARDLNTRWRKAQTVSNELDSADLRKSAAYSGANTDNTIRQRMRTLVDPTSGRRIRNATGDEQTALRKIVDGTKGQNAARSIGAALDPRKLGGKLLASAAGAGAPATGLQSLFALGALPVGVAASVASNRASQKNVEGLLSLIAAGGSKEALAKAPSGASLLARKGVAKGQELPGLLGSLAEALAQGGL